MVDQHYIPIQKLVLQSLESLQAAGIDQIPSLAGESDLRMQVPEMPVAVDTLELINAVVTQCTLCEELAESRTQTVFGVGNPQARLCFLGEAPGADEDRLGEPFVGAAGQLFNKILAACHLAR